VLQGLRRPTNDFGLKRGVFLRVGGLPVIDHLGPPRTASSLLKGLNQFAGAVSASVSLSNQNQRIPVRAVTVSHQSCSGAALVLVPKRSKTADRLAEDFVGVEAAEFFGEAVPEASPRQGDPLCRAGLGEFGDGQSGAEELHVTTGAGTRIVRGASQLNVA